MIRVISQCLQCKHYQGEEEGSSGQKFCDAFPDMGIPKEVFSNEFDHKEVHPEQPNDTTFELKDEQSYRHFMTELDKRNELDFGDLKELQPGDVLIEIDCGHKSGPLVIMETPTVKVEKGERKVYFHVRNTATNEEMRLMTTKSSPYGASYFLVNGES